jgi:hypothetical protein
VARAPAAQEVIVAVNDGIGNDVRPSFPGLQTGAPNRAPGTAGASGDAADDAGTRITFAGGNWQPAARVPVATSGTVLPDQVSTNQIVPGPQDGLSSTGAGDGRAGHFPRRSWQQGAS